MTPPNSTPNQAFSQPRFQGGATLAGAMAGMNIFERGLIKLIGASEQQHGFALGKIAEDIGMSYGPKAIGSRGGVELLEVTGMEFGENLLAYFGIAWAGQYVFQHLFHWMSPQYFEKKLIASKLTDLQTDAQLLKKVIPVKAGVILSSLALCCIMGEYALAFYKNLGTKKAFNKDKFSDVINLSQGQATSDEKSAVVQKAKHRIKLAGLLTLGVVALSAGLIKAGPFFHPRVHKALQAFIKHFDYSFHEGKTFEITRKQLMLMMAACAVGFSDAARDEFELKEVALRLPLVFGYLLLGEVLMEKLFQKLNPGFFKPILDKSKKTFAGGFLAKKLTELEAHALDNTALRQLLKTKMVFAYLPRLAGVIIAGFGATFVNRALTKMRYHKKEQAKLHQPQVVIPTQAMRPTRPVSYVSPQINYSGFKNAYPVYAQHPNTAFMPRPAFSYNTPYARTVLF